MCSRNGSRHPQKAVDFPKSRKANELQQKRLKGIEPSPGAWEACTIKTHDHFQNPKSATIRQCIRLFHAMQLSAFKRIDLRSFLPEVASNLIAFDEGSIVCLSSQFLKNSVFLRRTKRRYSHPMVARNSAPHWTRETVILYACKPRVHGPRAFPHPCSFVLCQMICAEQLLLPPRRSHSTA